MKFFRLQAARLYAFSSRFCTPSAGSPRRNQSKISNINSALKFRRPHLQNFNLRSNEEIQFLGFSSTFFFPAQCHRGSYISVPPHPADCTCRTFDRRAWRDTEMYVSWRRSQLCKAKGIAKIWKQGPTSKKAVPGHEEVNNKKNR